MIKISHLRNSEDHNHNSLLKSGTETNSENSHKPTKKLTDYLIGEEKLGSKIRFFKLISDEDVTIGKWSGNTPLIAATKAFRRICNKLAEDSGTDLSQISTQMLIRLKEVTQGSTRQIFIFDAERIKLKEPFEATIMNEFGTYEIIKRTHKMKINLVE